MNKTDKIRAILEDDSTLSSKLVAEVVGCTKRTTRDGSDGKEHAQDSYL